MKSFSDTIYREMTSAEFLSRLQRSDMSDRYRAIDEFVQDLNITKSRMHEVELSYPGTALHVQYLLQTEQDIPFGLCEFFKMWRNAAGWQYACRFDIGRGRSRVSCGGKQEQCSRPADLAAHLAGNLPASTPER